MHPVSVPEPSVATRPASAEFIFESYAFDADTCVLELRYKTVPGREYSETIQFPVPPIPPTVAQLAAFDRAAKLLFLLAGVSYYKTTVAEKTSCAGCVLDAPTADFLREVYLKGLGEFAYRNDLDLDARLHFPAGPDTPSPVSLKLEGALVPVGGGKDSIVSIELLKAHGVEMTLFALASSAAPAGPIAATIAASGLEACVAVRTLSPELLRANKDGAYNGHVPITAILSVIALGTAILHGKKSVIMSNEHSASTPNLMRGTLEINHQYSKSFAFEAALQKYIHTYISPDLEYFSLLRPLTEVAIAKRFAQHEQYHAIFRSCNTAFRQDATTRGTHWCCVCPKCRFVFLALAPFVAKEKLVEIFGQNLLADMAQRDGFAELCGLQAFKPFECVGEVEESALLLKKLSDMPEWQDEVVVKDLAPHLPPLSLRHDDLFSVKEPHAVPPAYLEAFNACA